MFYTVWGNTYDNLFILSLNSLLKNIDNTITVKIYTDKIYTDNLFNFDNDNVEQILFDFPINNTLAMSCRYLIASKLLEEFDSILFLDCDTICISDLNIIFNNLSNYNKIFVASEKYINEESKNSIVDDLWAGNLLSNDEKYNYKNIDSFCAGIWFSNKYMIQKFIDLYEYIKNNYLLFNNVCLDQPFFCYFLLTNDLYDFKLQNYVSHMGLSQRCNKFVIIHFAGGVTPSQLKYNLMKTYE